MKKRLFAIFLTLAMVLTVLPTTAAAADAAAVIELTETSGTVTVSKSNGKAVTLREGMRLYNGYNVTTAAGSYAWISLDSTKLLKVDASSSVEVRKDGSKLEVNIKSGSMYFEVTQKLNSNESLNISSSTMTVGIRGTSGWVRVTDQWVTQASILEGSSQCVVADPVTNQLKSAQISGGQTAQCVVYPQNHEGDKCDIVMEQQTTEEIPGFVLTELVENIALCDKILDAAGLDVLADLARAAGGDPSGRSPDGKSASLEVIHKAEERQSQEETETAQKQEKIEEQLNQQENNISQESVWEQPSQTEQTSQPSDDSSTSPAPTAYTIRLNANGGTVTPTSLSTNADGKLAALPVPERAGCSFDGWFTAADGGEQVTQENTFTESKTLYAHWTLSIYTVTFDANGGTVAPTSLSADADGKLAALPVPERAGCSFDGWFTAADGGEQVTQENTFTENTTLYAHWTWMSYTVTFDYSDAASNDSSASTTTTAETGDGGTLSVLPVPARPDFTFASGSTTVTGVFAFGGWYDASDGGAKIDANTVFREDTTVYAHWTADVTVSGSGAMKDYAYTNDIEPWHKFSPLVTTLTVESGVTGLGNYAFDGCTALTTVTLPASVNNIGQYTFENCRSLTGIAIPSGLTHIRAYTFRGCSSLTSITLPATVKIIDEEAFKDCTSLASVTLPDGITEIRACAFQNTALTSITIPGGVTAIDNDVFTGCTALTDIYYGGTQAQWDAYDCGVPKNVTLHCSGDTTP